jgi:hypothetical protein
MLEKLDGDLKHYKGKRGACIAFFQLLIANDPRAPREQAAGVIDVMRDTGTEFADATDITDALSLWSSSNGLI